MTLSQLYKQEGERIGNGYDYTSYDDRMIKPPNILRTSYLKICDNEIARLEGEKEADETDWNSALNDQIYYWKKEREIISKL